MLIRRLIALAVTPLVVLLFTIPAQASSSASGASTSLTAKQMTAQSSAACAQANSAATTYQTTQITAALANNPAGTCVGLGEISWDNGNVIMYVPAQANFPSSCPNPFLDTGWACVYNVTQFRGTRLQFHDCCFSQDLQHYGGSGWQSLSYASTRHNWITGTPYLSYLYHNQNPPHGLTYCMEGNSAAGIISGSVTRDRWIFLSNIESHC